MFGKKIIRPNKVIDQGGLVLFFCLVASLAFAASPSVGTITPSSGVSNPNQAVNFTTTYSDPDGWQNIQYVHLLINTAIDGRKSFYGYYNQNTNKLYLRNDDNTAWLGGYAPASANIIENSYVKLNCALTTVAGSGTTLTVKWNITFKSTFLGNKNTYLYVKDDTAANSGWVQKGTWRINSAPLVGTITPSSGSGSADTPVTFTTTYSDPNGWQDIQNANLLINKAIDGRTCFYGYYNQNTNKLYLRDDANSAWLGGYIPGSANTIENSYVKLDCSQSTASGSGNILTVKWTITFKPSFVGTQTKNTYLYVKDDYNLNTGWVQKGTWLVGTNSSPSVGSIIPSSGTSYAYVPVTFTTTYSDPNGWQNIQYVHLLINTAIDGRKSFYGYYNQNTNKLYLRDDANAAWLGGYAPGSTNTIENSYAKLNCANTTISGSGTTLTVNWNITFKSTFTGAKNTYLYVKDDSNVLSGWLQKGTWSITPNQPPTITSITPLDNSTFLAGAKINIQVNASDPDNDPLQYQISIGGTVKQAWSSSNTYAWQTSSSDTGAVNITYEVRDSKAALTSKTISCRIINPTVQEILQKVVDNYAKIYDFKADMTLSSTLNGQPFGTTEYCRYYFKAPNKEKTESFTDSTRATKTEVIIINGSTMYLIDTVNRITQQVDLLTEGGITSAQFNQMDIYYNLTNFLNNHTVAQNNAKTDFINIIVCLDAVPKTLNNLYSKLELYIDYNKGLLIKSLLYKEYNLLQTIEVVEVQQMPNGAWSPKKMNKIPVLTSGNLIETATYSNLQINVGLTDSDFDPSKQY